LWSGSGCTHTAHTMQITVLPVRLENNKLLCTRTPTPPKLAPLTRNRERVQHCLRLPQDFPVRGRAILRAAVLSTTGQLVLHHPLWLHS
jgi:hypothetical protein